MSGLRLAYLALTLLGAVVPMRHLLAWLGSQGGGPAGLMTAWQVNAATTGLLWEVILASLAFTLWVLAETLVRRNWSALIALPVAWILGLACGLPLYLFLRTRPVT